MTDCEQILIQARVTLRAIDPPFWRASLRPRDMNLVQLHEVLEAAFGWTDSHLHQCIIGGLADGPPEFQGDFQGTPPICEATETQLRHFSF